MNIKKILLTVLLASSITIGLISYSTNRNIDNNSKHDSIVKTDNNTNESTSNTTNEVTPNITNESTSNNTNEVTPNTTNESTSNNTNEVTPNTTNESTSNNTNEVTPENNNIDTSQDEPISSKDNINNDSSLKNNISEKTKNYIINGQENKPESQKFKWSESFLNQVDIESLYNQYMSNEGISEDLESFAKYMTLNAPIPSNWKSLFEKDLFDVYGEKVVKLEHLNDDLYQAYVLKDGSEVPYVVVSSRTGYFHG